MRGCTCRGGLTLCPQCVGLLARAGHLQPGAPLEVSEKAFMQAVLKIARDAGWLAYHTWWSKRSPEGFPDLVLVHPTRPREASTTHEASPVYLVELKTATGQVTPAQQAWVDALDGRTTVAAVWRPDDVPFIMHWLR